MRYAPQSVEWEKVLLAARMAAVGREGSEEEGVDVAVGVQTPMKTPPS